MSPFFPIGVCFLLAGLKHLSMTSGIFHCNPHAGRRFYIHCSRSRNEGLCVSIQLFSGWNGFTERYLIFLCRNQAGLSRKHIFDSVKASLKRLDLDYIDVLQCHRFDYWTPIEETMQALHDVVKAGYVRYIGMSSCYAYQFNAMQNYAITHNLTPFISMQNHYNILYREEEREMMPSLKVKLNRTCTLCTPHPN